MPLKPLTPEELQFVEIAKREGYLPEACMLVDYDCDVGTVPEHWRPKPTLFRLFKELQKQEQNKG